MSSILRLKRSNTAGAVPAALAEGEVAVNTADKQIFVGDGSAVIPLIPAASSGGGGLKVKAYWAGMFQSNGQSVVTASEHATMTRLSQGVFQFDLSTVTREETDMVLSPKISSTDKDVSPLLVGFEVASLMRATRFVVAVRNLNAQDRDFVDPSSLVVYLVSL